MVGVAGIGSGMVPGGMIVLFQTQMCTVHDHVHAHTKAHRKWPKGSCYFLGTFNQKDGF